MYCSTGCVKIKEEGKSNGVNARMTAFSNGLKLAAVHANWLAGIWGWATGFSACLGSAYDDLLTSQTSNEGCRECLVQYQSEYYKINCNHIGSLITQWSNHLSQQSAVMMPSKTWLQALQQSRRERQIRLGARYFISYASCWCINAERLKADLTVWLFKCNCKCCCSDRNRGRKDRR